MASSTIGANVIVPTARPNETGKAFSPGDRETDDAGNEYVYVQANGAITGAGYVCTIDETYQAAMVSTSNDAEGDLLGVPSAAFADDDYGWLQIKGVCVIRVAASCAANVPLNTTATAGQLDDDGTAGSIIARGLYLTTANDVSAATAAGIANWPIQVDPADTIPVVNATTVNATTLNVSGVSAQRSTVLKGQAAPAAKTVTAGLSAAEIIAGLITTTGVTAPSIHQLPTGSALDAALPTAVNDDSFDFTIINTGTGASDDATITVNTDVTIVGSPTIGALTDATIISGSGRFRCRRTGTHVWVVYRLA